jgi:hypothetical protein
VPKKSEEKKNADQMTNRPTPKLFVLCQQLITFRLSTYFGEKGRGRGGSEKMRKG